MRRYRWFATLAILSLTLDQLTKAWARAALAPGHEASVFDGVWLHRLSYNTGTAFSLFAGVGGTRVLLSLAGVGVCAGLVMWLRRVDDSRRWLAAALGLLAGGALGNVIDRVVAGRVTDFVVWRAFGHEWPTFNVADAALLVGVGILFFAAGGDARRPTRQSVPGAV